MRVLRAIASETMRSALRSHVVHVVGVLVLLVVVVLPITVEGDGTAAGQVQVSLTYTLGLVGLLLSAVGLWLGATSMADDIETYHIHMTTAKPVSRTSIWLGRWLGVSLLLGIIMLVAATIILALTQWRIARADYGAAEMRELNTEVRVGRRVFHPERPDLREIARVQLARRLADGAELPPNMSEAMALETIIGQLEEGSKSINAGEPRFWRYTNLPNLGPEEYLALRYRFFLGGPKDKDQRVTYGTWGFLFPGGEDGGQLQWVPFARHSAATGSFSQVPLGGMVRDEEGRLRNVNLAREFRLPDGSLIIGYLNEDPEGKTIAWQEGEEPSLLIRVTGFVPNYARAVALLVLQVAFAAGIGCAAGAAFSGPVAIFLAASYLLLGMILTNIVDMSYMEPGIPPNALLDRLAWEFDIFLTRLASQGAWYWQVAFVMQSAARMIIVSLGEFNEAARLARGELIEVSQMTVILFKTTILRGLPLALLGIFALNRRELGLVVRR